MHCYFGPASSFPCDTFDFHNPAFYFCYFRFKQSFYQLRMCTGDQYFRSLGGRSDFQNIQLDSLGRLKDFSPDLFVFSQYRVHLSKVNADISSHIPLYDTGYDIFFLAVIFVAENLTLLLANFLQNHIFCILGGNTPKFSGLNFNIYHIPQLIPAIDHLRIGKTDLHHRVFHFFYNRFSLEHMVFAGFRIHIHLDVF